MTLILMRRASKFDEPTVTMHLQAVIDAHPGSIFVTGRSPCYVEVLHLAQALGIKTTTFENDFYDPEMVYGSRKMNWLLAPNETCDSVLSLQGIYHTLALELERLLNQNPTAPLFIYLDQLMLEMAYGLLVGRSLNELIYSSIYLDELSIALLARTPFRDGFHTLLLKSNVRVFEAFSARSGLRLVR